MSGVNTVATEQDSQSLVMNTIGGVGSSDSAVDLQIDSLTTQTAPAIFDTLDTIANVSSVATDDKTIAAGDVMILQLSSTGLSDALSDSDSDSSSGSGGETLETATETEATPEARLLELVRSGAIDIQITQTNAKEDTAKTFNLSATIENGGFELLYDEETVYLLIDTNRAVFEQGGTETGIDPGEQFEVTVTGDNNRNRSMSESVSIVPRTASFDTQTPTETVVVKSAANQTVTAETTVAPGTNLTVQARSNGQPSFIITRTVQVRANGTFSLDFDFANITKGTSFELMIPNQGFADNASKPGIVHRSPTASVSISNQNVEPRSKSNDSQRINLRSANLSDGGFVALYNQTFLDSTNETEQGDGLLGTSQYLEANEEYTNLSIPLNDSHTNSSTVVAVPYLDTNDDKEFDSTGASNSDEPYSGADGGPVIDSANVSVGDGQSTSPDQSLYSDGSESVAPTSLDSTADSSGSGSGSGSGNEATGGEASARSTAGSDTGTESSTKQTHEGSGNGSGSGSDATAGRTSIVTDETTGTQGPGFGPIVGLVAVGVCVVLLVIRR